jgi:PilX N-terminal
MIPAETNISLFRRDCRSRQKGSALVITLLVLTAVTILGVASIDSSVIELKISANEREMRENFYLAEGAAMEGVQRLSALEKEDLNEQFVIWHHPKQGSQNGQIDFRDPAQWDGDGAGNDNCLPSALAPKTYLAAVEWKVATGGSLIATESRLYQNRVYGLSTRNGARNLIEIGYNLRY